MKIKTNNEIEYWITSGSRGEVIRVYRQNSEMFDQMIDKYPNPFTIPIMVENRMYVESLAKILDDRDRMVKEIQNLKEINEQLSAKITLMSSVSVAVDVKKRWYEFWKGEK